MKKALVIVILVIFIASIAIVNFFGLEIGIFDGTTYVTGIQCDTVTLRRENGGEIGPTSYMPDDSPIFTVPFIKSDIEGGYTMDDESLFTNPNAVEINYAVFPYNADDQGVTFVYDSAAIEGVAYFSEAIKTLVFLKPNVMVSITLVATDGSNISTKLNVIAIPQN